MLTDHDTLAARCPRLGHEITFAYCRQPGSEVPCGKIFDCWWEKMDIQAFIEENYSKEIQMTIAAPPKPKMLSLMELIEEARKRNPQE